MVRRALAIRHWRYGIAGYRIAIIGHSHHEDAQDDGDDLTIRTVRKVIDGKKKIAFFTQIWGYFGFEDNEEFWNRVMFFNYLPERVGAGDERYKKGPREQVDRAKARFQSILRNDKPDKVLVFTNSAGKGWPTFPRTLEQEGDDRLPLGAEFPKFSWGRYEAGGHIVIAFGLRHPQGAPRELMRRAVGQILALPRT